MGEGSRGFPSSFRGDVARLALKSGPFYPSRKPFSWEDSLRIRQLGLARRFLELLQCRPELLSNSRMSSKREIGRLPFATRDFAQPGYSIRPVGVAAKAAVRTEQQRSELFVAGVLQELPAFFISI